MSAVKNSLFFSLFMQFFTGLIGLYGLFIPLQKKDNILREVLTMETVVQFIEGFFYIWFAMIFTTKLDLAKFRYYDWVFTTPTMLTSTIMYYEYVNYKNSGRDTTELHFWSFLRDNASFVIQIMVSNFLMLLCGYLQEIGVIDIVTSTTLGFAFFAYTFYIIYSRYASKSEENKPLYYFNLGVWGLYGIAAMYPNAIKNTSYNLLDIVAKNFYGLYITKKIWELRIQ